MDAAKKIVNTLKAKGYPDARVLSKEGIKINIWRVRIIFIFCEWLPLAFFKAFRRRARNCKSKIANENEPEPGTSCRCNAYRRIISSW